MPSVFYYITLREKCQTIVFNKKALDKQGVLAYNKDRKSIPVDGLLPLLELRFNRRELVAGAVISFSCRGDSDFTIFMIIVNVQDHADQIQQKAADLQQITKGDILIHHTDHLPSVPMSSGSKNQKKT